MSPVPMKSLPDFEVQPNSTPQLYRLTVLRFFAAVAVFGYHLWKDTDWLPKEWMFRYGFAAVGFFFILSGFVLTWAFGPSTTTGLFYVKRLARVYPSHLVMAVVALFMPVLAFPVTSAGVFANLGLVQAWFLDWSIAFSLNAVSWSLSCEAFFYLLSPWLIRWLGRIATRPMTVICASWFALCSLLSMGLGISSNTLDVWAFTNPLLRSGEFVAGIAIALLVRRSWAPRIPPSVAIIVLVGAMTVLAWSPGALPQTVVDVILAPFFAIVIVAAAVADVRQKKGLGTSRFLVYAGQVSFAFYLVHELAIFNLAELLGSGQTDMPGLVRALIAFSVSFLAAVVLHHVVELRAQKVIVRAWKKFRTPSTSYVSRS